VGKCSGDWQRSGRMCTVKASRFGVLTGSWQRDIIKIAFWVWGEVTCGISGREWKCVVFRCDNVKLGRLIGILRL
jgi:hypothetical protein